MTAAVLCRRLSLTGLLTALVLLVAAGAAAAASGPYVSLGDSYTAAPLVPLSPVGNPLGCGRSTNNYPSDVARVIAPSSFTDVSCSSATTADMTAPQSTPLGTNPPQFNALSSADALVTVGIGGNDAGLIGVVETCAEIDALDPFGSACKHHYDPSGNPNSDPNVAAVEQAGRNVAGTLAGIHARAGSARVLVVGYPDGLPLNSSCWPLVPLSTGDVNYINSLEEQLNSELSADAAANSWSAYVNTFTSSIGHDACQAPGVAWVNGIIPTSLAFPLHPNQAGEQNMANQVLATLGL